MRSYRPLFCSPEHPQTAESLCPAMTNQVSSKEKSNRSSASGFTLLEVMVAIAVLAIALTALLASQSRTMLVADNNDFAAASARLGALQLSELLVGEPNSTPQSAAFAPPFDDYFWEVEFGRPFNDLDSLPTGAVRHLQPIDLVIGDERRDQTVSVTRYRFSPDSR